MKSFLGKTLKEIVKRIQQKVYLPLGRWAYSLSPTTKPLSKRYGLDRGIPIDRYYIEYFLAKNVASITGRCLEVKDNIYTLRYGQGAVTKSDILDIDKSNPRATLIGDLRDLTEISDNSYNCIILTQVLQFIDDYEVAIRECFRILAPGGVLLVTLPTLSRIDVRAGEANDFWRFTKASAWFIFSRIFPVENLTIETWGNAVIGAKFWLGFAQEDVPSRQLGIHDPNFPCLVTVKAQKPHDHQ